MKPIQKVIAYKITLDTGEVVSEGFCGVSLDQNGETPSDLAISMQLLQAAMDRGVVAVGMADFAEVTLLWVKQEMEGELKSLLEETLQHCPSIVETYRGGEKVTASEFLKPSTTNITDEEFLKACGVLMDDN